MVWYFLKLSFTSLDYTFLCSVHLQAELSDVFSYEEIEDLISNVPAFAVSQNTLWKVKWRNIDVIVKGLFNRTARPNEEVLLHK
jgi:hypothetical protein